MLELININSDRELLASYDQVNLEMVDSIEESDPLEYVKDKMDDEVEYINIDDEMKVFKKIMNKQQITEAFKCYPNSRWIKYQDIGSTVVFIRKYGIKQLIVVRFMY